MSENPYAPPKSPLEERPNSHRIAAEPSPFSALSDKKLKALGQQIGNLYTAMLLLGILALLMFVLILRRPFPNAPNQGILLGCGLIGLSVTLVLSWNRNPVGMWLGTAIYAFISIGSLWLLISNFGLPSMFLLLMSGFGLQYYICGRSLFKPNTPRLRAVEAEIKRRKKAARG